MTSTYVHETACYLRYKMADAITHTEAKLLISIANGNEDAFRIIYNQYRSRVFSIACKILKEGHLAEDAVQEVFTAIWLHRDQLSQINNLDAYLNILTRNHLFNQLKKIAHAAQYVRQQQANIVAANPVMEYLEYNELHCQLVKVVDQLPPQQKKVYRLGKEEGLRYDEIAHELSISKETVKTHMSVALRTIKAGLRHHQSAVNRAILLIGSLGFLLR